MKLSVVFCAPGASSRLPREGEMAELSKEAVLESLKKIQKEGHTLSEDLKEYCAFIEQSVIRGEGEELVLCLSGHFLMS